MEYNEDDYILNEGIYQEINEYSHQRYLLEHMKINGRQRQGYLVLVQYNMSVTVGREGKILPSILQYDNLSVFDNYFFSIKIIFKYLILK
jgi:hypothetical protein